VKHIKQCSKSLSQRNINNKEISTNYCFIVSSMPCCWQDVIKNQGGHTKMQKLNETAQLFLDI